jgi:acetyl esterase
MELDPHVRTLLETVLLPRNPPFDPDSLRLGHLASQEVLAGELVPVMAIDGFTVEPDAQLGTPRLAVRRYRPRAGCTRAIVWLHGGGWVNGTLDGYDAVARALAVAADSQVFVVDYRLAPEAPYPAPLADCTAAVRYLAAHAERFGIDPGRLVLGGDSAGGHLAIGACRWLARRAAGIDAVEAGAKLRQPAALLLVYPVTDARMLHRSYARFAQGYYLSAAQMAWFWQQYAPPGVEVDGKPVTLEHPDLSPLLAEDLHCLPPTLVVTAQCDVLHDEGQAFAAALRNAGVVCDYLEIPAMIHGCLRFRAALRQARELPAQITARLDRWKV